MPKRVLKERIIVSIWDDEALSVEMSNNDYTWCIAALENAIDAVRNLRDRSRAIVIPNKDVSLPERKV